MSCLSRKLQYNSPVVLTFFLISLASLVLGYVTNGSLTHALFTVYRAPLTDPLTYVRFVGHVLGHADFDHFLGNMLLFLVIGPPMEEKYGSETLLEGIILTAVISGLLQFFFFPDTALLGASGIVFMLIMLASLSGMKEGQIPLTMVIAAALYLSQEVYSMFFVYSNVANFMHIVGGACGTAFGFLVAKLQQKLY